MTKEKGYKTAQDFQNLCSNEKELQTLLISDKCSELIYHYFHCGCYLPQFETALLQANPQLFVDSIRANFDKSFLDEERLRFYAEIKMPENLVLHKKVWKYFQQIEKQLWKIVEQNLSDLINSNLPLENVLNETVIWLEQKRFSDPRLNQSNSYLQEYSSIYNTFIQLFLREYGKNHELKITSSEKFTESFCKCFANATINPKLSDLLANIENWEHFKNNLLYQYCFDDNFTITEENSVIYLKKTPKDFYRWKLDGCRYELNRFYYSIQGADSVDYQIKNGYRKIQGNNEIEYSWNYQLACQQEQVGEFLYDLKINNMIFNHKPIEIQNLFLPLLTYSINQQVRYEAGLAQYKSENWQKTFGKLMCENMKKNIASFPFFLMTKQQYINLNKSALQELGNGNYEELIKLFSYTINLKYNFQKYNNDYEVFKKPFIVLDGYLFCPTMFLANNDWFYAFANAGLENLDRNESERRKTAHEMESYLCDFFKNKHWNARVFSGQEANNIDGDIDIAVNGGDTTLLIQLKRPQFRLSDRERYNEKINSDRKASKQLNNAAIFIQKNPYKNLWQIKSTVHKWIVSTSFENILADFDGCLKVNYFELLYAFNNPNIKTLDNLIDCMTDDEPLKNLAQLHVKINANIGFPQSVLLTLDETKAYNIPLFAESNSFQEYHSKFNKALELGNKKNFETAIKVLKVIIVR